MNRRADKPGSDARYLYTVYLFITWNSCETEDSVETYPTRKTWLHSSLKKRVTWKCMTCFQHIYTSTRYFVSARYLGCINVVDPAEPSWWLAHPHKYRLTTYIYLYVTRAWLRVKTCGNLRKHSPLFFNPFNSLFRVAGGNSVELKRDDFSGTNKKGVTKL